MSITAKNTVSKEYTGNKTFPANNNRGYFFIVMTDGTGTISFGGGGGEIPLESGYHYEPGVCPLGEITVTTTSTYVIHMG